MSSPQAWKNLFKELDDLLLQEISNQIQQLMKHFQSELFKHYSQEIEDENYTTDNDYSEKKEFQMPDNAQQLLIEYTCLPVCRISVDPKPSSNFSLSFIYQVLFKQFHLNVDMPEHLSDLFNKIIIPLLKEDDENKKKKTIEEMETEREVKKQQFIDFLNGYFASLVFVCQFELLTKLTEYLDYFSVNIKIWVMKAFFTKFLTTSQRKCQPLRELSQKVLTKYQNLFIKEEGPYVHFITTVEFLTDKLREEEELKIIKKPITKSTIAFQLTLRLLQMSLVNYSQDIKKRSTCLYHCIQILKYGELNSIQQQDEEEEHKKKKKNNKKEREKNNIKGFYLLLNEKDGEEMIQIVWEMLTEFIENYDTIYDNNSIDTINRNSFIKVGYQNILLFDLIFSSIQRKEITNYYYLNDCFIPFVLRLVKAFNEKLENINKLESNENIFYKNIFSLKSDCKLLTLAIHVFIKYITKTNHSINTLELFRVMESPGPLSKLPLKRFIEVISNGLIFECLLNATKYLFKENISENNMKQLYWYIEKNLMECTKLFFYLYHACSLDMDKVVRNDEDDDEYNKQEQQQVRRRLVNEEGKKFRHIEKLNIVFQQLIECACMLDYNQFVNKALDSSPNTHLIFHKQATDLNKLMRTVLVTILQKPFLFDVFLTEENRKLIVEKVGLNPNTINI
ncbi:hypothetical protein ABK040_013411 [Willaertia magna]